MYMSQYVASPISESHHGDDFIYDFSMEIKMDGNLY